jgi:hypothetical protein
MSEVQGVISNWSSGPRHRHRDKPLNREPADPRRWRRGKHHACRWCTSATGLLNSNPCHVRHRSMRSISWIKFQSAAAYPERVVLPVTALPRLGLLLIGKRTPGTTPEPPRAHPRPRAAPLRSRRRKRTQHQPTTYRVVELVFWTLPTSPKRDFGDGGGSSGRGAPANKTAQCYMHCKE